MQKLLLMGSLLFLSAPVLACFNDAGCPKGSVCVKTGNVLGVCISQAAPLNPPANGGTAINSLGTDTTITNNSANTPKSNLNGVSSSNTTTTITTPTTSTTTVSQGATPGTSTAVSTNTTRPIASPSNTTTTVVPAASNNNTITTTVGQTTSPASGTTTGDNPAAPATGATTTTVYPSANGVTGNSGTAQPGSTTTKVTTQPPPIPVANPPGGATTTPVTTTGTPNGSTTPVINIGPKTAGPCTNDINCPAGFACLRPGGQFTGICTQLAQ